MRLSASAIRLARDQHAAAVFVEADTVIAALDHAVNLAEQIRANVESKKLVKKSTGDILGTITISIGVAQLAEGESVAELIQRADACLYRAKNSGRNCVIGENDPRYTSAQTDAA